MATDQDKSNTNQKKGWFKYLIIGGVLVAVAIGGFVIFGRNKQQVVSGTIQKGNVSEDLVLTGSVKAVEDAKLFFPVSGRLLWVGVKEGQEVKKGQTLAQLDATVLKAAYEQALSDVRSTQATVEKVHDDVKDHDKDETFTQKQTRTVAEVARDKAYQSLWVAQDNLKNAILRAPFDGVVANLVSEFPGVSVLYSSVVVEIVNPKTIYFEVTADQTEIKSLKQGQKARMFLDSYSDIEMSGVIESIALTPKEGEAGTVYVVKVKFDQLDLDKIRIGMTGDARLVAQEKSDVLYVDPKFINSDKQGRYLKVGSAKNKTYIETGINGEERVEVKGEIKEGQTIYD